MSISHNRGIAEARGRYVLNLDSDTEVLPGSFERLVEFMDGHPECGAAAAKLINDDRSLQYSCRWFYPPAAILWRRTPLGRWFPDAAPVRHHLMMDWDHNDVREIDWMLMAGFIIWLCAQMAIEATRRVGTTPGPSRAARRPGGVSPRPG